MPHRALALLCFFLSGSTGLMYEVLWTRIFGGTIGNTHFSITVVVSVFMGGLGLGSYLGGRIADRSPNPLRLYGVLTLLVGLSCLLVPFAVHAARPLFAWLYSFNDGEPEAASLLLARILVSAAVLLVPTSFMGATLPVLSRHLTRSLADVGRTVGRLYALNTLGAVAGALFTGFAGVRFLGLWGVTGLAVAIDLAIGIAILIASRARAPGRADPTFPASAAAPAAVPQSMPAASPAASALPAGVRLALFAFGVAGFADMLLQIAWTKAIVLSIGNSTYAFSLIVTLFILGIAIGGGIMASFADRIRNLLLALGVLMVLTGALVSVTIPLLGHFPILAARLFDSIDEPSYGKFLWIQLLLVSSVILPSTILMGTVFPVVGKIRTRALESVGSAVGSAYFWNTMGSILGTLAAGFVFIPILGRVYYTLYLGAGLSILMGAVLLHRSLRGLRAAARAAIVLAAALVTIVPHLLFFLPHGVLGSERHYWHEGLMSRGAYVYYHGTYRGPGRTVLPVQFVIDGLIAENRVLLYEEGIHAPVAVVQNSRGETALRISGKVEASLAPGGGFNMDLPHQVLAGHLPMILCSSPRSVLTLGLGGGVTLGTLTLYPVDSIDSLEISPEVIAAAREHFGSANRGALTNPKVRNVIGDGRNHIEYTSRRYDVITSVPSNPWIAGIGNLFTVEFFEACRDRLNPGGVLCNWIHKINLRSEDFRTVVRTFLAVFEDHAQLWDLGYDCLLIGSSSPLRFDPARFASLIQNGEIARDLSMMGLTQPETFLRHYLFDASAMRAHASTAGPLNTDAFPVLEFSAPYGLYGHYLDAFSSLASARFTPVPADFIAGADPALLDRARRLQGAFQATQRVDGRQELLGDLLRELSSGGIDGRGERDVHPLLLETFADLRRIEKDSREAKDSWLRGHASSVAARALGVPREESLPVTISTALFTLARSCPPEARLRYLEEARELAGESPRTAIDYAVLCLGEKRAEQAIAPIEAALGRSPDDPKLLQIRGILEAEGGKSDRALVLFEKALAKAADPALRSEIHLNMAYVHQLASRWDDAVRECESALRENPANAVAQARIEELKRAPRGR